MILSLIPLPYRLAAGAAALALAAGGLMFWGSQRESAGYDRGTAEVTAKWTAQNLQLTAAAVVVQEKYRATETALREAVERQRIIYDALQQKHSTDLAGQRAALADAGRLRIDITAYASGSGRTPDNPGPSDSARAAALGLLLADALRASAESTAGAESAGDAVRALLAAWPRSPGQ